MGWGAAYALYEEMGWLDSPEDAYEVLYGAEDEPRKPAKRFKCKACGKRFRSHAARKQHQRDKGHEPQGVSEDDA